LNIVVDIGKRGSMASARALLVRALLCVAGILAATTGCSTDYAPTGGPLRVVATTDVYASIVRAVAGDRVDLTTFITSPSLDPHTFEADARDELAIARADVIVENGGGYDDFADRLRAAAPGRARSTVLNAVAISGKPVGPDLNEHVWYDFPTVIRVAQRLDAVLGRLDPAGRSRYVHNTASFVAAVRALERREAAIRAADQGAGVAITERVPLYLLAACGLVNRTPPAFSDAVENDSGVSPQVLDQTLELFRTRAVRALVYNAQTVGPETTRVIAAAHAAHVAVVPVTETLAAGTTYLSWMDRNLTALEAALDTR
jgi:zinc/manganese transport system substrate-binding protein